MLSLYYTFGIVIVFIIIVYIILKLNCIMLESDETEEYDVDKTPRCPDCRSYELEFVDTLEGVEWLKRTGADCDFYTCKRCGRSFGDENWQEARKINR